MNKDKFPRLITPEQAHYIYATHGGTIIESMAAVIDAIIESIVTDAEAVARESAIAAIEFVTGRMVGQPVDQKKTHGVLTDAEINELVGFPRHETKLRAENDRKLAREVEAAVLAKAAPQSPVSPAALEAMRHCANEWADMATSAVVALRNVVEGITTPAKALKNMEDCLKHCRAVNNAPEVQQSICALARLADAPTDAPPQYNYGPDGKVTLLNHNRGMEKLRDERNAAPTPPTSAADALCIRFTPASEKLPVPVEKHANGDWSANRVAVITSDGYVTTARMQVSNIQREAILAGKDPYFVWRAGSGLPRVFAWADLAEVEKVISAIAANGAASAGGES